MATIDIYVVDEHEFDMVMWIDGATTLGDVGVTGVSDMVSKICHRCAGGDRIGELRISGHGNTRGQYFGGDWIELRTLRGFRTELARLRSLFARQAIVTLCGCQVGQNGPLLLELSNIWNVPVRAFTAFQRPLVPGDEGSETRCYITCTRGSRDNFWDWVNH